MEQTRTGDGRHQGPRAGERGEGPGGGGLEDGMCVVFFVVSCLCRRGLHGCMVAPSVSRCVLARPGKAAIVFGQPAQGVVVASCRTKAGAGLALAHGRCGSPRTAGWRTRVARDERQKAE